MFLRKRHPNSSIHPGHGVGGGEIFHPKKSMKNSINLTADRTEKTMMFWRDLQTINNSRVDYYFNRRLDLQGFSHGIGLFFREIFPRKRNMKHLGKSDLCFCWETNDFVVTCCLYQKKREWIFFVGVTLPPSCHATLRCLDQCFHVHIPIPQ